jgi:hypothetical protein
MFPVFLIFLVFAFLTTLILNSTNLNITFFLLLLLIKIKNTCIMKENLPISYHHYRNFISIWHLFFLI